jgi:hypothetical protein
MFSSTVGFNLEDSSGWDHTCFKAIVCKNENNENTNNSDGISDMKERGHNTSCEFGEDMLWNIGVTQFQQVSPYLHSNYISLQRIISCIQIRYMNRLVDERTFSIVTVDGSLSIGLFWSSFLSPAIPKI